MQLVSLGMHDASNKGSGMLSLTRFSLVCALGIALAVPTVAAAQMAPTPTAKNPHYFTRAVSSVTLSAAQKAKIASITAQYRKAHPDSAPHDSQAEAKFHQQISDVLTPPQRAQVQARLKQLRAAGVASH